MPEGVHVSTEEMFGLLRRIDATVITKVQTQAQEQINAGALETEDDTQE
jgi:hypothetical protein